MCLFESQYIIAFLLVVSSTNHLAGCTGDAYEGTMLNVRKRVSLLTHSKNLVQGVLVNGTPGTVISFQTSLEALSPVPGRPEIHLGYIRHSPKPSPLMDRAERKAAEKRLLDEMRHVTQSPRRWPVVRFRPRGREPIDVICVNNVFELTDAFGNVIAVRRQASVSHGHQADDTDMDRLRALQDPTDARLGTHDPQEPGSDPGIRSR